ncbi:carbohydrate ABC transporter permease [Hungatella hathewayi]|nr:carbohydrate ABC transporter permease [Hungatella hathewayi]
MGGVPKDLEEAALIDGANLWKLFWKIVFPLLKPVTTTIVIFDVMWIWNDFMLPYLFISSSDKFTLIMEVYKGVGQFANNWTVMLCTMVIVLIPITIFYVAMQKHIIAGITSGAVKG